MIVEVDATSALTLAGQLYTAGNFDQAIQVLELALVPLPNHAKLRLVLSSLLSDRGAARVSRMNKLESGFSDLLHAVEVDDKNWRAHMNVCSAAWTKGDYTLALDSGKKAIALEPRLGSDVRFRQQLVAIGIGTGVRDGRYTDMLGSSGAVIFTYAPHMLYVMKKWWQFWR